MNPRIEVVFDGVYVVGLVDGREMLAASPVVGGGYRVCSSCTINGSLEFTMLYTECIKAVVEKCNELQNIQE